jgi:D-sedoheptulose 7-phosphate isomerase
MASSAYGIAYTHYERHRAVFEGLGDALKSIADIGQVICDALADEKKLMICGNGGSAADSQHFAAELVGRFKTERRALPAIALSTDTSALTSIGNDYGFEHVFARQVSALAKPGDIVVGISTSGSSKNVLAAAREGRSRGAKIITFTGSDEGPLLELSDLSLRVPSAETARIQEIHIFAIHCICAMVDGHFAER